MKHVRLLCAHTTSKAGREEGLLPHSQNLQITSLLTTPFFEIFDMIKFKYEHGKKATVTSLDSDLPTRLQGPVLSHRAAGFAKKNNYF